ncbi:chromosome partitioning protein [Pseudomonas baetica]|uniref:Chromosome partitioning protein n=1 Tax=Pseudomonas baetica TaxID=674054 RepID=A0ABX4Q3H3_9PSED|nr:ParA family protein [Pseudomonas baetica]PKA71339.1 chromosome partitioning protein [Pseudomonas baetica]
MAAINNSFYKGKVISALSTKGGVGKSTDCLHIGYQLKKKYNLSFQYLDADAQESGTNHFICRASLLSDCKGETDSPRVRPIPDDVKRLVKRLFKDSEPYVMPNIIKKSDFANYLKESKGFYDGFIIDTQGSDSTTSRNAVTRSDIVIIPVNPSGLVINELHKALGVIMTARSFNPNIRTFIVFNRVVKSATKMMREHIETVNEILSQYLFHLHNGATSDAEQIYVCETVITERQDVYNNVDVGLNAFELSKGKTCDAEIQFDTLLDEIEYKYNLNSQISEVA